MNPRRKRIRRQRRKDRRATHLVATGYVPSLGHLRRASSFRVIEGGHTVVVGDMRTVYRWSSAAPTKGQESVVRPIDGSQGKWLRQREADRR